MTAQRLFSRALIRVSPRAEGEDVAEFLQGLVTNDVTGTLPAWAGLLTPQGKTLFDFIVWPAGHGELLLDCEADAADELVKRLSLYRLRRKIGIERDDTLGVYWQPELGDGGAPDPRLPALGQRWIAKVGENDESADAAWTKHRLSLGVAEGRDIAPDPGAVRMVVVPLDTSDEKRRRVVHSEHGLAVDHLRVEDMDPAFLPDWLSIAD